MRNLNRPRTAEEFQDYILPLVSRTFSLTIPQLPLPLRGIVGNFYLLCRAVDTIEDDPELSAGQKRHYGEWLVDVVAKRRDVEGFAAEVAPLISQQMPAAERELILRLSLVIKVTHGFTPAQHSAIARCVSIMSRGMHDFQASVSVRGLDTRHDMYSYCYYVSGVVGEALTEIFCDYSAEIAGKREAMLELATSFGIGLQVTNILMDQWEDRRQGQCWLPRDVFARHGVDLSNLEAGQYSSGHGFALAELIGIAHVHLRLALNYTLLIPANEPGIRRFCYWAIGLAMSALGNMHRKMDFSAVGEIKVPPSRIAAMITLTKLARCSDGVLIELFNRAAANLPLEAVAEGQAISEWHLSSIGRVG